MTHIALFLPDLNGGGAERVMLTLAKYFVGRGHRVDLVLARAEGALLPLLPPMVRLVDLQVGWRNWGLLGLAVSATLRLAAYLRRERPDVLLSTLTGANLVAVLARFVAHNQTRSVLREACSLRNVPSTTRRLLMKFFYSRADRIVALTPLIRDELVHLGIMPDRIIVIANPIDIEYVRSMSLVFCPHPWFIDRILPVVVTVGRLTKQKDHVTLIFAFKHLIKQMPARLLIIGEGSEKKALETLIDRLNLHNNIHLIGFDSNPWRWMGRADLFVLSSRWEGYPNVLLEAQALGVPIVSTEYDVSVYELLGKNGVIVPAGNTTALSEAISMGLKYRSVKYCAQRQSQQQQDAILSDYINVLLSMTD